MCWPDRKKNRPIWIESKRDKDGIINSQKTLDRKACND